MAKVGLNAAKTKGLLTDKATHHGWVLCVGAGISRPAFPDWRGLVRQLIALDVGPANVGEIENLQAVYSADALIQAAMDRLRLDEAAFADTLAQELYADVRRTLSRSEWDVFTLALTSRHIGRMKSSQWKSFEGLMVGAYPHLTAHALARIVVQCFRTTKSPAAIISFNAEPLFAAFINAQIGAASSGSPKDVIDWVTHATSDRVATRVPYLFCHGLLPVPGRHDAGIVSSVDKLVFSEGTYLQLANSGFSWQSATFLRAAATHTMVFVGLSLADPNMRRWLSWVHAVRVAELTEVGAPAPTSTVHYWIAKEPGSPEVARWTESVVAHLGVRVVWVTDYAEIGPTLAQMLSVSTA